ncbi:twin-arginine translocation signal domain-containing protein [Adlercreutzia sp.]|uniref:twin-arginine translocation signal domain-containing protein n=1 Tax=Adlercreutzia sp. TaxID=1872387 RepID=UPI002E76AEAA|nr:twin-arginine translocation signal domain-containing protein [Adlercreutzia sp.]MEE0637100.1 twin-arginine translocation signal domain-containing protein [Adlercreutzia sp.]
MGKTAQTFGKISRRSFLGLAGATGVGVALTGCAPAAKQEEPAADSLPVTGGDPLDYDTVSWSSCHVNCGSRCPLKAYVKEGQVVRIDIDSDGDDEFGPGKICAPACAAAPTASASTAPTAFRSRSSASRALSAARASTRRSPGTRPSISSPPP